MAGINEPATGDGVAAVVWITGASSGIGQATAIRYVRAGYTVVASARSMPGLAAIEGLAAAAGPLPGVAAPGRCHVLPLDVTDAAAVATAVAEIETEHGPIASAILNAGTHVPQPIAPDGSGLTTDGIEKLFDINVMGAVKPLVALLPRMIPRRRGQIAVVASVAGYGGLPGAAAYGATKAGLINMTESLKLECDKYGLDIRLVCPGFVKTPLTDKNDFKMPFLMPVEDAAAALFDGLTRSRRFEIVFPKIFAYQLKFLRLLPYGLYFRIVKKVTNP